MDLNTEKLDKFFEETKTLTFWGRLFGWSRFRALSYDAYQEFKLLLSQAKQLAQDADKSTGEISILKKDIEHLREKQTGQDKDLSALKDKTTRLEQENGQLKSENITFKQTEDTRRTEYDQKVATLTSIRDGIESDRKQELAGRQQAEIDRLEGLKATWAKHQTTVQETIKAICQTHTITYVDKVPFKGAPDNTIKVANEFVIFDAKSPASDNLGNFPTYIKVQAEAAKKYVKEESVKRDVFLVIPSNTVEVIEHFSYNLADYNVYVVTLDALEPIILSLKRLEEYEFVDQLSPDERDNICRVIGRFAHITKRRIQIDQFFDRQFLEILMKAGADLPTDILDKVIEYERAEKVNPPLEKRAKLISTKALESDSTQIRKQAEAQDIAFPPSMSQDIRDLPLYIESKPDSAAE